MPMMVPTHTIVLQRDKKRVELRPGRAVEFSDAELAALPEGAVRKPVNEAPAEAAPAKAAGKGGTVTKGDKSGANATDDL